MSEEIKKRDVLIECKNCDDFKLEASRKGLTKEKRKIFGELINEEIVKEDCPVCGGNLNIEINEIQDDNTKS